MLSKALICLALLVAALPATADVLFSTGFEAPDYVTGDLTGQQGWTISTTTTNVSVTGLSGYVIEGAQSMLVTGNAGRAAMHSISGAGNLTRIEVKLAKAQVNTGQWWVALQKADGSGRSGVFGFNNGNIQYYRGGSGWTTYSAFSAATAYAFTADVDIANKTYALWVNGVLVDAAIPTYSTAAVIPEQVYLYRGYLSLTGLDTWANYAVADSLAISSVPEPSSLLALVAGLGGVAGYIRRRR